jgi:hypothetical protein
VLPQRLAESGPVLAGLLSVGVVLAPHAHGVSHEFGHHALHIGLVLLAFVVFAALVARDVARNGWPAFSWRL